jgi:hypothetical protein
MTARTAASPRAEPPEPPEWALTRAGDELYDEQDPAVIRARARQIVREVQQLQDEEHDEFDDPDQGGEG